MPLFCIRLGLPQQNYFRVFVFSILLLTIFPVTQALSAGDTGFLNPAADQADTGGHSNGYETHSKNAYVLDGLFAVDTDSGTSTNAICSNKGKDRHRFYNYGIAIPAGSIVKSIEVRLDAKVDSTENSSAICVQLSWDGGTSWTASKMAGPLGTSLQTFILGTSGNTSDHTWSADDLSNTNFRVRVSDVATDNSRDFSIDWVAVRVSYDVDVKGKGEDSRRSAR